MYFVFEIHFNMCILHCISNTFCCICSGPFHQIIVYAKHSCLF